jgi:pimeloyl-ACP methyl ester carboxylesterase
MNDQTGPKPSRRTLNAMLLAAATSPLLLQGEALAQGAGAAPRPFRVDIPQATIDRILNRVRDAQWPDRLDATDWRYGANWDYMKSLAQYWTEQFDWRRAEANLNRYPQFVVRVGDYDIHFYHVKGRGPKPMPLILTHGWPGSVFEFLESIGPLSDPASFGGSPDDAFDVIVPSLPGFGFSSKPNGKPIGAPTTATLWNRLMTEVLGYTKYGAQGGDVGSVVTAQLARQSPESLFGVHFNGIPLLGPPPPESEQTPEEQAWAKKLAAFVATERDYFNEQQRKPQTIGFPLTDSPLGTAAWIVEKLKGWSDSDSEQEPAFNKDQVLTNIMIYLVTNTIGTSAWFFRGYLEDQNPAGQSPLGRVAAGRVTVPTGKVSLPRESPALDAPQSLIARYYNLVRYTKIPRGGHFAFWEQPEPMVADVREFFRTLRS